MAGTDFEKMSEAGEYVLGTLDAAERIAFEARLTRDGELQAEVAAWRRRLTPLDAETAEAEPPAQTFAKILARIDTPAPVNVVELQRRVRQWRIAATAFAALAASLILFFVVQGQRTPSPANNLYVAVLQGSDAQPAFVAAVDVKTKSMVVRRVGAATPPGHSYELWALGGTRAAPQPLGVIGASMRVSSDQLGGQPIDATTLAVSLEPPGGSPTGAPTGPVLFTGKLIATQ